MSEFRGRFLLGVCSSVKPDIGCVDAGRGIARDVCYILFLSLYRAMKRTSVISKMLDSTVTRIQLV